MWLMQSFHILVLAQSILLPSVSFVKQIQHKLHDVSALASVQKVTRLHNFFCSPLQRVLEKQKP